MNPGRPRNRRRRPPVTSAVLWMLVGAVASFLLWLGWELSSWSRPSFTGWLAGRIASFVFGTTTGPRVEPKPAPAPKPYPHRPI